MSNYGTSYNISQTGDLYAIQDHGVKTGLAQYTSSRGTTVNAPVNQRKIMLFKGVDNEMFFFVKNQDRKPIALHNLTINASLIDRLTGNVIVNKNCVITDYELSSVRLTIETNDIINYDDSMCDLVLTYTNDRGLTLPLYTDLNMRPNFTVEISSSAGSIPLTTQVLEDFLDLEGDDFLYSSTVYGPAYYGRSSGMLTIAAYTTNYTGEFYLQGTTSDSPSTDDWFDLELGYIHNYHAFINTTGIEPFVIKSNINFLRIKYQNTGNGTVDKVVFRV